MINYNSLNSDEKQDLKKQLSKHASLIGGKNYFLSLIEAIRLSRPHPLMAKEACFRFDKGIIRWEKVIFKEKVNLLITLIRDKNNNLMPKDGDRNYKTVMNLLRTIGPMNFEVRPKNRKDGDGFIINPIQIIDKNTCKINFIFEALFFLPMHLIKKMLIGPTKI
ncbi:MAG: hypothetical protein CBD77_00020 [bacterium TMED217]|nr:MAG: hypothetical protein CBD77_00020 [bacterium TMED217]|tara:strand:+ start:1118 stop:1609 length:492 start_codon:yes stop_codon:yes gene_type:complete